jgi:hypothetical protein
LSLGAIRMIPATRPWNLAPQRDDCSASRTGNAYRVQLSSAVPQDRTCRAEVKRLDLIISPGNEAGARPFAPPLPSRRPVAVSRRNFAAKKTNSESCFVSCIKALDCRSVRELTFNR